MSRGRPARSKEHLKVFGGYREDRHGDQPDPPPDRPVKPTHLDPVASGEWDRVVPIMVELGTLATTDLAVLISYCQVYSQIVRLETYFATNPDQEIIVNDKGNEVRNPRLIILEKARTELRYLINELGFSAKSRRGVVAKPVGGGPAPYARKRG